MKLTPLMKTDRRQVNLVEKTRNYNIDASAVNTNFNHVLDFLLRRSEEIEEKPMIARFAVDVDLNSKQYRENAFIHA